MDMLSNWRVVHIKALVPQCVRFLNVTLYGGNIDGGHSMVDMRKRGRAAHPFSGPGSAPPARLLSPTETLLPCSNSNQISGLFPL